MKEGQNVNPSPDTGTEQAGKPPQNLWAGLPDSEAVVTLPKPGGGEVKFDMRDPEQRKAFSTAAAQGIGFAQKSADFTKRVQNKASAMMAELAEQARTGNETARQQLAQFRLTVAQDSTAPASPEFKYEPSEEVKSLEAAVNDPELVEAAKDDNVQRKTLEAMKASLRAAKRNDEMFQRRSFEDRTRKPEAKVKPESETEPELSALERRQVRERQKEMDRLESDPVVEKLAQALGSGASDDERFGTGMETLYNEYRQFRKDNADDPELLRLSITEAIILPKLQRLGMDTTEFEQNRPDGVKPVRRSAETPSPDGSGDAATKAEGAYQASLRAAKSDAERQAIIEERYNLSDGQTLYGPDAPPDYLQARRARAERFVQKRGGHRRTGV